MTILLFYLMEENGQILFFIFFWRKMITAKINGTKVAMIIINR